MAQLIESTSTLSISGVVNTLCMHDLQNQEQEIKLKSLEANNRRENQALKFCDNSRLR